MYEIARLRQLAISQLEETRRKIIKNIAEMDLSNNTAEEEMRQIAQDMCKRVDEAIGRIGYIG